MSDGKRIRVLIAKPGLDGHDRGAKVVTRFLRDRGFEVIYMGLRQSPEKIAATARDEDAQVVGLSILSGAHLSLTRKVRAALDQAGLSHVKLVVGGTIPEKDAEKLRNEGAAAVFPTGTGLSEIEAFFNRLRDPGEAGS